MNPANEFVEVARGHEPTSALPGLDTVPGNKELGEFEEKGVISSAGSVTDSDTPTEEELHKLHRVSGAIPWVAYTIAFVELCERFSYYGTTVVCRLPQYRGAPCSHWSNLSSSRQLHPATDAAGVNDRCISRRPAGRAGDGTARIDGFDNFQRFLGLHDAYPRCLRR